MSAADPHTTTSLSALLRIHRDDQGQGFIAADVTGLRYGFGDSLREAVNAWVDQLDDILEMPESELGEPLRSEVAAYRRALA
jgi:hypothetical protein